MKSRPSNPFAATQRGSSQESENPFERAAREAQAPSSFQQEEQKPIPTCLPERRNQSEPSLSPFSIDTDPASEKVKPSSTRMSEPMEGFATLVKASKAPEPVEQASLVMPAPFKKSTTKPLDEVPSSSSLPDVLQPVDESQLVLRAIFGVAKNLSRDEVLQKASSLPGIMSVQALGPDERVAFGTLREGIQRLGHRVDLEIVSKEGSVELMHDAATTLLVLHEGEYRPGVREMLIIVAREFSQIT